MVSEHFFVGFFLHYGPQIVAEMYDKFFPDSNIIMNKKHPHTLRLLFLRWEELFDGDKRPKYTDWVKAFVENHLDYPS